MIEIAHQPIAERILRRVAASANPPQQLLFYGPPGTKKRTAARQLASALIDPPDREKDTLLDLTVVAPTGASIRLEAELEPALRDLAALPSVGKRRVVIIEDADRLREQEGAPRILKALEEPGPRSHVILVTDRPEDLLPTIRSRCLPVPFRTPGWKQVATILESQGMEPDVAAAHARADGVAALDFTPAEREMRAVGAALAQAALLGSGGPSDLSESANAGILRALEPLTRLVGLLTDKRGDPAAVVRDEYDVSDLEPAHLLSPEMAALFGAAREVLGKRGERTALKRIEDQAKRELRRSQTDGWTHVLDGAAGLVADALALVWGSESTVRHLDRLEDLRVMAVPSRAAFIEQAMESIQQTRSELELNPTLDVAIHSLLVNIDRARHGHTPLRPVGRLPV